jgi:type VI secretion system secreted protein VgrG
VKHGDMLGEHVTVALAFHQQENRHFDGIAASFVYAGVVDNMATYHLKLRPWFWLMSHHRQCRIFQEKTVPDIIKEMFSEASFTETELRLSRSDYATLEYCVQYRESDFAFISRLMEQEGIYYFFTHDEGRHVMVICDGAGSHRKFADRLGTMRIARADEADAATVWDWSIEHAIHSGQTTLADYNFKKPQANLLRSKSIKHGHAEDAFEHYDYPGKYVEGGEGEAYVAIRMEEEAARYALARAKTRARWMAPGHVANLADLGRRNDQANYLITETTLAVDAVEARGADDIQCEFGALSTDYVFRPKRRTAKPVIAGPQTAVVVGKSGEEIWTDEYGRVKVQFHWDRDGKNDEKSSCWIRCAQIWAGKSWGGLFIPRMGQEVVVHFLEGDPDRPLVTGAVYNGANAPPYSLPDDATKSTIKSDSSKGGNGSNELRFEDKKGSEEFFAHAEKDMNIEVENDRNMTVKKGNETIEIEKGNQSTTVMKNVSLTLTQGNYSMEVKAGKANVKALQEITVESTTSITLKVMNNSIKIDPTGVTIKGNLVTVEAVAVNQIKGLAVNVQATAVLTAKGAITMIG